MQVSQKGKVSMAARNRAHLHARLKAFGNDLRLDLIRPGSSTRRALENLKPAYIAPYAPSTPH
jgi:hypothetical protein